MRPIVSPTAVGSGGGFHGIKSDNISGISDPSDLERSTSAPTVGIDHMSLLRGTTVDGSSVSPENLQLGSAEYKRYYQQNRKLNPRLPAPVASNGLGTSLAQVPTGSDSDGNPQAIGSSASLPRTVLDRIQEDFPRTPSPIIADDVGHAERAFDALDLHERPGHFGSTTTTKEAQHPMQRHASSPSMTAMYAKAIRGQPLINHELSRDESSRQPPASGITKRRSLKESGSVASNQPNEASNSSNDGPNTARSSQTNEDVNNGYVAQYGNNADKNGTAYYGMAPGITLATYPSPAMVPAFMVPQSPFMDALPHLASPAPGYYGITASMQPMPNLGLPSNMYIQPTAPNSRSLSQSSQSGSVTTGLSIATSSDANDKSFKSFNGQSDLSNTENAPAGDAYESMSFALDPYFMHNAGVLSPALSPAMFPGSMNSAVPQMLPLPANSTQGMPSNQQGPGSSFYFHMQQQQSGQYVTPGYGNNPNGYTGYTMQPAAGVDSYYPQHHASSVQQHTQRFQIQPPPPRGPFQAPNTAYDGVGGYGEHHGQVQSHYHQNGYRQDAGDRDGYNDQGHGERYARNGQRQARHGASNSYGQNNKQSYGNNNTGGRYNSNSGYVNREGGSSGPQEFQHKGHGKQQHRENRYSDDASNGHFHQAEQHAPRRGGYHNAPRNYGEHRHQSNGSHQVGTAPSGPGGLEQFTRARSDLLEELRSKMKSSPLPRTRSGHHGENRGNSGATSNTGPVGRVMSLPNSGLEWGLPAIKGHVFEFARDQYGSRFIQQQLESPSVSPEDKLALFEEVLPHGLELCSDVFGNYVVQKLLDDNVGSPEQQKRLCIAAVKGSLLELSLHMYGCRVVQKVVEQMFGKGVRASHPVLSTAEQNEMLLELKGSVMRCVQDQNGNHVIQKCIEQVRPVERIAFILDDFVGELPTMATHPYGCRVVQRLLEYCGPSRVEPALQELVSHVHRLVTDQYGNYVVQHVVQHGRRTYAAQRQALITAVRNNLVAYATHKFASNVVEKCLQFGDATERRKIIAQMLGQVNGVDQAIPPKQVEEGSNEDICPLQTMMKDPYANYVVQKVLDIAEPDQLELVVVTVRQNAQILKTLTYGKHILTRLEKINVQPMPSA